ncbi:poly(U) RNA binding protein [Aureococcus anophagefferens]|uniref:Poly(U) RNA binding protein n=1 Tax=Aureococcus anophagefferens TaxID=44056 RepID=A0ABR1FU53_AURAN
MYEETFVDRESELDWETLEALRHYFGQFGEIIDVAVMRNKATGVSRGFGFVTYARPGCVDAVLGRDHVLDGRRVDIKLAVPRDRAPAPLSNKFFVGGLPSAVADPEFRGYFEQFGQLTDSIVMVDRGTNRSRGFGFVTYADPEGARRVASMQHRLQGKIVDVKRAVPGPGQDGGGGGGGMMGGGMGMGGGGGRRPLRPAGRLPGARAPRKKRGLRYAVRR